MSDLLIFLLPLLAFFAWAAWVLHKRSPNPPGEEKPHLGEF